MSKPIEAVLLIISEMKNGETSIALQYPDFSCQIYRDSEFKRVVPGSKMDASAPCRLAILNHHLRMGYELKGNISYVEDGKKTVEYCLLPPAAKKRLKRRQIHRQRVQ